MHCLEEIIRRNKAAAGNIVDVAFGDCGVLFDANGKRLHSLITYANLQTGHCECLHLVNGLPVIGHDGNLKVVTKMYPAPLRFARW